MTKHWAAVATLAFVLVTPGVVGSATAVPQWHQGTVVAGAGFIDDPVQAPGSTVVYGLVQVPGSFTQYRLQVLDLATKRLVRGQLVYCGSELVTVGDHVDLVEPTSLSVAKRQFVSPYALHVISPATARLGPAVSLPAVGRPLAGLVLAPDDPVPVGGLWAAVGRAPVLLSSETGAVVRRLRTLPATIDSLVVAPDGRRLYAEVGLTTVEELDATSGAVLASRVLYASGVFVEAATSAGVWVIAGSGMADTVEHLSSSGLVLSGPSAEAGSPGWDPYIGVVKLLGGGAWLVSGAGIACADPSGGALRGGEWFSGVAQSHNFGAATDPFVPIAAVGKDLYAVSGDTYGAQAGDVIRVTTPTACWEGTKGAGTEPSNVARPDGTSGLFTVVAKLDLGSSGPNAVIAALGPGSVFLTGAFTGSRGERVTLVRVARKPLRSVADAYLPDVTSVAYGDGALWWATGELLSPRLARNRILLKVDPATLKVLASFRLPGPPQLVTVAGTNLWVTTTTSLLRLSPVSGEALADIALGFNPVSLAASPDGTIVYVLGDTQEGQAVLADFASGTGRALASRRLSAGSGGPLAVVPKGAWVPALHPKTQSTTVRLFSGPGLRPGPALYDLRFDTQPYVTGRTLWLIDGGGEGRTICASPTTGAVRASGGPVTIGYGSMASDSKGTYLESNLGLDERLLQVDPTPACSGLPGDRTTNLSQPDMPELGPLHGLEG